MTESTQQTPIPIRLADWLLRSVDSRFYIQLHAVPGKQALRFLVILMSLVILATSISISLTTYQAMGVAAEVFRKNFPPLEFKNSELSVLGEEPVVYSTQAYQIIVDTKDKNRQLDPFFKQGFVLRKKDMLLVLPQTEPQVVDYKLLGIIDLSVDADEILANRTAAAWMVFFVGGGLRMFWWLLSKGFEVLLGMMFVGFLAQGRGIRLSNDAKLRVACTALAPPVMLQCVQIIFQMAFPGFFFLYLAVYGVFLVIGTRAFIAPLISASVNSGSSGDRLG